MTIVLFGNRRTFLAMKKSPFRPLLSLILILIFASLGAAQEPAYLHYDVGDGLPSAVVYCAVQDQKGLMWFGTDKGLVRFDGTRFKVFGMKDGLPDNEVVNIFEDSQGRIWLSCFGQHPAYLQNGEIISAADDSLLAQVEMAGNFDFYEDHLQRIWISTHEDFFYCLDKKTTTAYAAKNSVHKVGEVGDSLFFFGFWFIHRHKGKEIGDLVFTAPPPFLEVSPEALSKIKLGIKSGFPSKADNDFFSKTRTVGMVLSGKRVLYFYNEGLLLLELENGHFKEIDRRMGVYSATGYSDSAGNFWLANNDEGALFFNHQKDGLQRPQKYMSGKRVSQIYEDREGNIWFSTLHDGVYNLPKNAVQTYRVSSESPLLSNNITSIGRLMDGQILVGDDKGHIYFKKGNTWRVETIREYVGYNRIRQILTLDDNSWIAVSDKAIVADKKGILKTNNSMGTYKSACIHGGGLWAGTSRFLINWDETNSNLNIMDEGRTMLVHSDAQNVLWTGKLNGLFSEKDNFKKKWGEVFKPLSSRVTDIKQAGNDALWVATPDYGLLKVSVDQGKVTHVEIINEKLAKPIENIQSIFIEPNGKVWLSTNKGVFSIDSDWIVGHYGQTNGLASNDVNAVLVDQDTLWAATASGLSKLLLKQKGETGDFSTRIVGINYMLSNEKLQFDLTPDSLDGHNITIPAGATMLEVELASLHYRTRDNQKFEYNTQEMLLPFYAITFGNLFNYIYGEKESSVVIQGVVQNYGLSLTPGRFLSTATAILPGGTQSNRPDKILITVLPYWWQTLWVHLFVISVAAYFFYRIYKTRSAYLELQATTSELQLQAIKSQMNPHFVGNSINAIQQFFYPPNPEKASEYISIFTDLLRRTMSFSEVNFISFQEELQYVKDYLELVKLRFGDHFSYTLTGEDEVGAQTKFPAMLLQPILENATIHGLSPDGTSHLTVQFAQQKEQLTCTVTDNGVGIDESLRRKNLKPSRRPSAGLKLLDKKIQMLNQLYSIDLKVQTTNCRLPDGKNQGTKVVISFLNTGLLPDATESKN